jgi:hypothetical protein
LPRTSGEAGGDLSAAVAGLQSRVGDPAGELVAAVATGSGGRRRGLGGNQIRVKRNKKTDMWNPLTMEVNAIDCSLDDPSTRWSISEVD